jgi:tRNA/tmRNA/rRNA uracil-C5-methylase (TrmA/RlmC/RlmD family)
LFSLSAAEHFSSVTGIEISQMAVQAAQRNAVANDIRNVNFIWGKAQTLFDEVKSLEDKACRETAVIIDPSRKGCDISFLTQLLAYSPRKIVYVSCNPATQARDDYVISRVTPFDMFPQTKHIECVITLTNKNYNEACGDQ